LFSGDREGFLKMFSWPAAASMQVTRDELRHCFPCDVCDAQFMRCAGVDRVRWSRPLRFIHRRGLQRRLRHKVHWFIS
jgi:hypothetical protein